MAETYADLEEPLFLDEPAETPKRVVQDTTDLDELFACEEEPPPVEPTPPANHGGGVKPPSSWRSGSNPFVESAVAQNRLRAPLVLALILAGVVVGFALVLTLLG